MKQFFTGIGLCLFCSTSCINTADNNEDEFIEGSQLCLLHVEDIGSIPKVMFEHSIDTLLGVVSFRNENIVGLEDTAKCFIRMNSDTISYHIKYGFGATEMFLNSEPFVQRIFYGECTQIFSLSRLENVNRNTIVQYRIDSINQPPPYNDTISVFLIQDNRLVTQDFGDKIINYEYAGDALSKKKTTYRIVNHSLPDSIIVEYSYDKNNIIQSAEYGYFPSKSYYTSTYSKYLNFEEGIPVREISVSKSDTIYQIEFLSR